MKNDINTKNFLVMRRFGKNDNSDFFDDNQNDSTYNRELDE